MQSSDYFGMEMLWKLEQNNVNTKSDLMVLFVHWYLMRNGFRNVGVGDDKTLDNIAEQSELLPEGWNANNASYALRYTINNELYNLHGTLSNGTMIINLLHAKSLQVSNVVFNLDATVQSIRGSKIMDLIVKVDEQIARLDSELVKPIHSGPSKSSGTQTAAPLAQSGIADGGSTRRVDQGRIPIPPYGHADRDPLGVLGGGMLMDPLRPRMPNSGFFVPRPRIDPMGPVNRINQFPNPDHLPPPGYDDMFM
ncbi:proteasome inhibitor PI31 subunit [Anopheles stephensi]|uniref:Proteasome inhibitor PI31 subunit n=1 Tax=Anopheles stephensi TaxID=30069 RepID=A0A182XYT0_ANOST|nr:proteasome inhibitor PI31 subunit [Anopheles stephensi]